MRLHSDTLTTADVYQALGTAKDAGLIAKHVGFETMDYRGSRSRARAFEIQLGTSTKTPGDKRGWKNSGQYGAADVYAATFDEWGWFIAALFDADPDAVFGQYKGREHFHKVTTNNYLPADRRPAVDPYPYRLTGRTNGFPRRYAENDPNLRYLGVSVTLDPRKGSAL